MGRKEPVRERDVTKAKKKKEVITEVTEYSSKKKRLLG